MLQVLRMSGKMKVLTLDVVLVDGSSDQYVHISGGKGGGGGLECFESSTTGCCCTLSRFDGEVIRTYIDHVDDSVAQLLGVIGMCNLYLRHLQSLAVEGHGLCIGKNYRSA